MTDRRPPRVWLRLARWLVPAGRRDEVEGDLIELWDLRRETRSHRGWRFWRDAMSLAIHARRRNPESPNLESPNLESLNLESLNLESLTPRLPESPIASVPLRAVMLDLRYAFRLFRRQPLFSSLALTTIAVGIAASTAIFTVCDRVLLRPLPYPNADRVVLLDRYTVGIMHSPAGLTISPADATQRPEFVALGIYSGGGVNLGDESRPERLRAGAANSGFFAALAVPPLFGRTFTIDEDNGAHVAVVAYDTWRRDFHEDRGVLDRTIYLNGRPFTVVGVMPPGFAFPSDAEVWMPLGADNQMVDASQREIVIGRLAPGVSIVQATEALRRVREASGRGDSPGRVLSMTPLQERLTGPTRPALLFLAGVVGLLLMVTCANVAGLLLSRLRARERELAVRRALGATRGRLVRQLVTESLLLTGAGAAIGIAMASWAVRLFAARVPGLVPDIDLTAVDLRFFAVGALVSGTAGLAFTLGPALLASRRQSADLTREVAPARRAGWLGAGLVSVQTATALVLLAATSASLVLVSRLMHIDLGFHNDRAVVFEVTLPRAQYGRVQQAVDFAHRVEPRLRALPGVTHVGMTSLAPAGKGVTFGVLLRLEGDPAAIPPAPVHEGGMMRVAAPQGPFGRGLAASPDYFRALGIPLLDGRFFTELDGPGALPVAILSESAARAIDPQVERVVGKRLAGQAPTSAMRYTFPAPTEVVGIVADVRLAGATPTETPQVYQPLAQTRELSSMGVAIDGSGDAETLVAAARQILHDADPRLPIYNVQPIADLRARYLATERLTLALAGVFSLIALGLVAIGLYGVLAQFVAQRTREIGIRMALGADRARLRRAVVFAGLRLAAIGTVAGGLAVWFGWRFAASFAPQLDPPGAATVVINAAVLLAVAGVAAWIPARRASAVDPTVALRAE